MGGQMVSFETLEELQDFILFLRDSGVRSFGLDGLTVTFAETQMASLVEEQPTDQGGRRRERDRAEEEEALLYGIPGPGAE